MKLPQFFFYQYDLRIVDLSNILVGMFPIWLLKNNTRLEVLTMRKCCLIGPFLLPSYPNPYVSSIDISNNHLEGPIPTNIGMIFPNLLNLNMSRNLFEGYIPTSLGDKHSLEILDLSTNNFSGHIPEHLPTSLGFLKLSNNILYGEISLSFVNLTSLVYLYLDNNPFVGKFPNNMSFPRHLMAIGISNNHMSGKLSRWMGNMSFFLELTCSQIIRKGLFQLSYANFILSLVTLDVSDNNLSGIIPSWIGTLSELSILLLKLNNFESEIPIQLCQLKQLSMLDLSKNKFSGLIPHCFIDIPFETTHTKSSVKASNASVYTVYTMWSFVKGNILDYMSRVNLSCNHLTGEIPIEVGKLSNIHALNLCHSNLTGSIPTTFSHLRQIESLDLSYNNLNGRILSIDRIRQIGSLHCGTQQLISYEGNSLLCGLPLNTNCIATVPTSTMLKVLDGEVEYDGFVDMGVFYVTFLVSYIILLMGIIAVLFINPHWRQAWSLKFVCKTTGRVISMLELHLFSLKPKVGTLFF
ncbi:hypothetical protein HYC85_004074 [Camellia sinensis]|uniref:Leucine-rich repeat-containing N-terminal plant-type domain-containing protein n=1 Tax=Camellia sinensis TaxID=4442 RepID=A0A7J7HW17_CAMSI|nr:hypothetical protein HYC85_004074 [Camellia sinensis]